MSTAWVLYQKSDYLFNQGFVKHLQEELSKSSIECKLLFEEEKESWPKEFPCFVVNRTRNAMLAKELEEKGVRVFNSSRVNELANNKSKATAFVKSLGLPVVESILLNPKQPWDQYQDFPYVLKEVDGHGGKQVYWIANARDFQKAQAHIQKDCVLQKPVSTLGVDIRAYVIHDKIVEVMKRTSVKDFRSNYSLGGMAEEYRENRSDLEEMVQIITKACPMDYVGIDFLFDHGQLRFNEMEDPVGAKMVYGNTSVDLLQAFCDYMKEEMH